MGIKREEGGGEDSGEIYERWMNGWMLQVGRRTPGYLLIEKLQREKMRGGGQEGEHENS